MTKAAIRAVLQMMGRFSHDMDRWMWHWSGHCAIRIFAGGSNRYEGPGGVEQDCGSAGAEVVSPGALAPATELGRHLN